MSRTPTQEFSSDSAARLAAGGDGPRPPPEQRGFFGHPRGLSTLFFTELWERFSFYGMRALLVLFMTASVEAGGLGMDAATAGAIYGLYGASVYLMALPGGWLADRWLGQRHAVLAGGVIIAAGHFTLALPGLGSFYAGLGLIVVGTGLLKPNISTMVGELYPKEDVRRDAGFSLFYMGINIGAFLAPLGVGYLGERIDWHLGFGAAGVGMLLGLAQYLLGARHLGEAGRGPRREARPALPTSSGRVVLPAVALVGGLAVVLGVLQARGVVELTTAVGLANAAGLIIAVLALATFAFMFSAGGLDAGEKRRLGVIAVLFVASALFWAGFEQAGSSFNLFARELTDRRVLGWVVPASFFQSINALLVIAFAPVFAWAWVRLAARGREPSSPAKFSLGLALLGLGFLVMVGASLAAGAGVGVSPLWLVATYLLHTLGELSLSPVGLSTVTRLAPARRVGQMMGVWFMASSLGNLLAGRVAGQFEKLPLPELFGTVGAVALGAAVLLALLVRPLRRMMGGVH